MDLLNPYKSSIDKLKEHFDVDRKVDAVKEYAKEKPILTMFIVMMVVMSCIPIVSFLLFLVCSIVMVLIGFVFIEGTVLTFATIILGGVLCFVGLCSLGTTLVLVFAYYLVQICHILMERFLEKVSSTCPKTENDETLTETMKTK